MGTLPLIEPLVLNCEDRYEVTFDEWLNVHIEPLTKRTTNRFNRYGAPYYLRHFIDVRRRYLGYIYVIHFDLPYKHARHYVGWTRNIPQRMNEHIAGNGARLMEVITEAGIDWHVSRIMVGDRYFERKLKNRKGATRFCPSCPPRIRKK